MAAYCPGTTGIGTKERLSDYYKYDRAFRNTKCQ